MQNFIGESAALLTAFSWSFTSIFFTIAAKRAGSIAVNLLRLLLASVFLMVTHFFMFGNILPLNIEPFRWWWLGLSGFIGLVIGDTLLLQAFVIIGARLSMLLMAMVPIISTVLAWLFLNEILTLMEIIAIIITLAGIAWVVLEKNNITDRNERRNYGIGILFGLGGALGQALALITAKKGLSPEFSALTATLIRIVVATIIFWIISFFRGTAQTSIMKIKSKSIFYPLLGGSIFGPFIGIWLSLIAIKYANIGIASTLMALPPIFLLPLSSWFFKEKLTFRSIIGTSVAIVGVALIFLT